MWRAMSITARCTLAAIMLAGGVSHVAAETSFEGVADTPHVVARSGNFRLRARLDDKTMLEQPVSLEPGHTLRVKFSGATGCRSLARCINLSDPS
jgi:hypothetical protein